MKPLCIAFMLAMLLISHVAQAQIPKTINYQGVLRYSDNDMLAPDGIYTFVFRIYDADTLGTALWTEQQTLPVKGAILNVVLGSVEPIDLAFDEPYWLEVSIVDPTFEKLYPRIELTSVPYAFRAQISDTALTSALRTYDSGWFEVGSNQSYSKTHNLGTTKAIFMLYGATDDAGGNMSLAWAAWEGNDGQKKHSFIGQITTTTCVVRTGIHAPCACWNGSDWQEATHMRVVAVALE